ncbi:MAG TPA: exodeoxyribonuclease VII large subunit [Pyrinomonadaceae bacterium]|nr:exodeoxyribonuclease VII large subunit [Pyrinomonadaceae bacterium]
MDSPLLASLFEAREQRALSVSELTSDIKAALESGFMSVWVEGEITNFHAAASGHWYFSLTDGDSLLRAACFKGQNFRIRFKPSNGLQVRCRGRITLYEKRGEYQLLVESLEPVGEGALTVAFEQIKARLLAEGLFDASVKRPIPAFPRRVGIVTSPKGAAVHDILTVLDRRARSVNIVLIPVLVQGETAGAQIANAIELANLHNRQCPEGGGIDVLIVGRGGGSAEDLWAFNEEQVARAIRASEIPVISAVGHETDFTISDMAADLRAPTPSAAAEIVAESEADVLARISNLKTAMERQMSYTLISADSRLRSMEMAAVFMKFPGKLRQLGQVIEELKLRSLGLLTEHLVRGRKKYVDVSARLSPIRLASKIAQTSKRLASLDHRAAAAAKALTSAHYLKLERAMARLDALSPLAVLTRGYSITQKENGMIVRNSHQIEVDDALTIRLSNGKLAARVTAVEHDA